jgi:EmrB/QacA subfamily drug resistance transporter
MEGVDGKAIVTALPAMARDFGYDPISLKVAVTSYVAGLGALIPVSGWLADRFGAKNIFCLAIGIFVASSLACAVAGSLATFTAARFVQGMGGAMMLPVGRIIIVRGVHSAELVRIMNFLSVPALLGPAVGPLLGGFIATYSHWQLIFVVNVPLGILGILLTNRYIENVQQTHPGKLDRLGALLSGVGASSLLFGLSLAAGQVVAPDVAFAVSAAGFVLCLGFILRCRRIDNPLLDLRFLAVPTFRAGVLGGALFRIGFGAVPFLLPLLLQEGLGMTAFRSGLVTCGTAFGGIFMGPFIRSLLNRYGFRKVLVCNAVFSGVAFAACGMFSPGMPVWLICVVVLLGGFFSTLQINTINALTYAEIPKPDVGLATSVGSMVQQVSLGLGVPVAGIVLQFTYKIHGHGSVMWFDFWPSFIVTGLLSIAAIPVMQQLPSDAADKIARTISNDRRA